MDSFSITHANFEDEPELDESCVYSMVVNG